jgi:hypothetical protein
LFAVCSALKVNVAVALKLCSELEAEVGSWTWKHSASDADAFSVRSPVCDPCDASPIEPEVSEPEYTWEPSVEKPALEQVVTPLFTVNVSPSDNVVLPLIDVAIA